MKRRDYPEQRLQRAVAAYLAVALPHDAAHSAIGHGGGGRLRGAMLNAMGLVRGVPDFFIIYRGKTIFLELKSEKGRLSAEQRDFHARLRRAGVSVDVCRSLDDVIKALMLEGVPLCANVAA